MRRPLPPPCLIRPARPHDAEAIHAVFTAAVDGVAPDFYTPGQRLAWAASSRPEIVRESLKVVGVSAFVAEADAGVVGFALVHGPRLRALYVRPGHAGGGAGSALLLAAEEASRGRGLARLMLNASLNSRGFYARRGYAEVEEVSLDLGGVPLACVAMKKRL